MCEMTRTRCARTRWQRPTMTPPEARRGDRRAHRPGRRIAAGETAVTADRQTGGGLPAPPGLERGAGIVGGHPKAPLRCGATAGRGLLQCAADRRPPSAQARARPSSQGGSDQSPGRINSESNGADRTVITHRSIKRSLRGPAPGTPCRRSQSRRLRPGRSGPPGIADDETASQPFSAVFDF